MADCSIPAHPSLLYKFGMITQCVSEIRYKYPDTPLILGGDFNCPGIDWSTRNFTESCLPAHFRESLLEFAQDFLLEQIVLNPTRGNNILDLCFTPHPDSISQCKTVPGFSDHDAVIVKILYNIKSQRSKHIVTIEQTGMAYVKKLLKSPDITLRGM